MENDACKMQLCSKEMCVYERGGGKGAKALRLSFRLMFFIHVICLYLSFMAVISFFTYQFLRDNHHDIFMHIHRLVVATILTLTLYMVTMNNLLIRSLRI